MYAECMKWCGVSNSKCKNHYCEANPTFRPIVPKDKPKGGPGKPSTKARTKIKKEDGHRPLYFN